MHFYPGSTKQIKIGDKVSLGESLGKIVFIIDEGQFTPEYPKEQWITFAEIKKGIGILTEKYGLLVEDDPSDDLVFIESAK
jgi:hypothetical protein